MMIIHSWQKVQ